jgi:hypothetical protein
MKDKGDARSVHPMEQLFSSLCSAGSNPLLGGKKTGEQAGTGKEFKETKQCKNWLSSIQSTCKKTYN